MKRFLLILFIFLISISQINCHKNRVTEPEDIIIEESNPITDIDGNVYKTVRIEDQIWMAENLTVSHFRNGDVIAQAESKEEWVQASSEGNPAWCYYDNNPENGNKYGRLYNWFALMDPRGLAPEGWHIPSDNEWTTLTDYNIGENAGFKMKSTSGWNSNGNGDNTSLFNALPGGGRTATGDFAALGTDGLWWSTSENNPSSAWGRNITYSSGGILRGNWPKGAGLSVRAVVLYSHQDSSNASLEQKLQKALDDGLNKTKGKGVSAAVIFPDGSKWVGVSGVSHGSTAITPDMSFGAGSIAKNFTAATILKFAEEGEITLDDSLHEWVPAYPYVDSTINIRQLLNHTSGLFDIIDNPAFWEEIFQNPSKVWTPAEMIIAFNHEPLFPKGTDWNYSSIPGYALLRMIIEDITGSDEATAYNDRFFVPFELNNTFASMGEPLPANTAHGWYDLDNDGDYEDFFPWPRTAFASGVCGEVFSTPEDLAKWARVLFHDRCVLNAQYMDEMLTFHSPCTGEESQVAGYGLGTVKFNPDLLNGLNAIGHSGNAPGYAAACIYLPDYDVCIGFMDNTECGESVSITMEKLLAVITGYLDGK